MMRTLTAMLLCGLHAMAFAQSVSMPETVTIPVGRLAAIELRYDGSDCKWDVPPALDVFREFHPVSQTVKLRVIGYTEGTHRIVAVATKDGQLSPFAVCLVHVGRPSPTPTPTPEPTPEPTGLARKCRDWFSKCASPDKVAEATSVAANFRAAAAAQRAGAYAKLDPMSVALRERNQQAIAPQNRAAWRTAFFAPLDAELSATVKTLAEYGDACEQIAIGLENANGKNQ